MSTEIKIAEKVSQTLLTLPQPIEFEVGTGLANQVTMLVKKVICMSPIYELLAGLTVKELATKIEAILKPIVALLLPMLTAWVDGLSKIIASVLDQAVQTGLSTYCER